jgi:hypothetical protein
VSIPLHGKDAISVIPCFRGGHVQFYSVDENRWDEGKSCKDVAAFPSNVRILYLFAKI